MTKKKPQSKLSTTPPKPKMDDIRRETAATKITAKQARTDGQGRKR